MNFYQLPSPPLLPSHALLLNLIKWTDLLPTFSRRLKVLFSSVMLPILLSKIHLWSALTLIKEYHPLRSCHLSLFILYLLPSAIPEVVSRVSPLYTLWRLSPSPLPLSSRIIFNVESHPLTTLQQPKTLPKIWKSPKPIPTWVPQQWSPDTKTQVQQQPEAESTNPRTV